MKRAVALLVAAAALGAAHAEPDETALGKAEGYPVGRAAQLVAVPYRVGSWSALDRVDGVQVRRVPAPAAAMPLPAAAGASPIRYRWRNLGYSLDEYLERQRVTGLLVLKDGAIVAERYRYGRDASARFLSFSMAKSVTSLLVGIAQARGAIASLDDAAATYAKELAGSAYGETSLRHLLRMSSGIAFAERYDGNDDVARMTRASFSPQGTVPVLRSLAERHAPSGERFVYASAETEVLGRVLRGATGRSVAELTADWLWAPLGAEHEAFWRIGGDGQEAASGYFNASLRDWGRLGVLLARDGRIGDTQVVPREFLRDATDAARQPAAFQPRRATPSFGYGYQFWLLPMRERTFAMFGVYGQALYVQPASGIVMVQTSVFEPASPRFDPQPFAERDAFWRGVLQSLGGDPT